MIEHSHVDKFAAVFAEAILTFLDSGEMQWLAWDGHSLRFDFGSTELDPPAIPVMLFVDEHWDKLVGDVGEVTDPESPHFDSAALRKGIEMQIAQEGFGERLLLGFQQRLARLESGEDEDGDEDVRGEAPDDEN